MDSANITAMQAVRHNNPILVVLAGDFFKLPEFFLMAQTSNGSQTGQGYAPIPSANEISVHLMSA